MAGGRESFQVLDPVVGPIPVDVVDLNRDAPTPTSAPVALLIEDADP